MQVSNKRERKEEIKETRAKNMNSFFLSLFLRGLVMRDKRRARKNEKDEFFLISRKKKRIHSFPHFPSFSFCRVFTTTPLSFFLLGCFVSAKQVPFFRTRQHYLASFERGRQSCHLLFLRFWGRKKGFHPLLLAGGNSIFLSSLTARNGIIPSDLFLLSLTVFLSLQ